MHPFLHRASTVFHATHEFFHHHPRHATGRGPRGFPGFGGRHGGLGDPRAAGFDGLQRGRKLGSADLQLLLLALLAERASHGYELIKALAERSNGYYTPSPGMVYPALTYLEEIGHASVEVEGTKKRYSLTEAGVAHLESERSHVDALLEQLAWIGQRMDAMRQAVQGGGVDAGEFDAPGPHPIGGRPAAGTPEMRAARRSLKSALIEKAGASIAEQRRIAAILDRAAAEIRGADRKE